jgi:3-phenylpropionate/trans-cinnamate dioxygenase ferredoxin reductase component
MAIVIVGAGQAGGWVAATLRQTGYAGEIALVGEELHPPYERPPLSKEVLLGQKPPESTHLWPKGLQVTAYPGRRAERIERDAKRVVLSDGATLAYEKLVLATGGRVRRLPQLPNALYLRTIDDTLALRAALLASKTVLVVGGGWIGLEVAAAARKLERQVTLVEVADRLCARVLPPRISAYLYDLHRRHGVDVRLGTGPADLAADVVVVGIGIQPNSELAETAGLAVANGIVVDEFGQTSDPDIYAAGDVANLRGLRLESWANAQNQAVAAAKSLLGQPTPYRDIPWFWSDQHGVNIQTLGIPAAEDELVVRGDPARDAATFCFLHGGRLASLVAINAMRDLRVARKLMAEGRILDRTALADAATPLQALLQ